MFDLRNAASAAARTRDVRLSKYLLSTPCGFFWMSKLHGAAENSVGIRLMWSALPAPMTAVFKAYYTESSTVLPVLGREGSSTTSHINWF